MNTGRSITNSLELTLPGKKHLLLRVVVSRVLLPQSDPNLVLIDDPIKSAASINNPDIRREDGANVV